MPFTPAIAKALKNRRHRIVPDTQEENTPSTAPTIEPLPLVCSSHDVLPISLNPPQPDDFKAKLLQRQKAIIEVLYKDGSVERKPWNASRFKESSDVFGNLRSRLEFRQGVWQKSGIVEVRVWVAESC